MSTLTPTPIQWADRTANPVTGCTKVSPGCRGCYAERGAARLQRMGNLRYLNGFALTIHEDKLEALAGFVKREVVFVNSMSDLFHEAIPDDVIRRAFELMAANILPAWLVLTKRADRLAALGPSLAWAPHVWMGVSVEDERPYNAAGARPTDRIEQLLACGASSLFLSVEPQLGPVPSLPRYYATGRIAWAIQGGESGPGARPLDVEWVRDGVAAARAAGVAPFVKQLGSRWAKEHGAKDAKGGDPAEWPEDLRVREFPPAMLAHLGRERP